MQSGGAAHHHRSLPHARELQTICIELVPQTHACWAQPNYSSELRGPAPCPLGLGHICAGLGGSGLSFVMWSCRCWLLHVEHSRRSNPSAPSVASSARPSSASPFRPPYTLVSLPHARSQAAPIRSAGAAGACGTRGGAYGRLLVHFGSAAQG